MNIAFDSEKHVIGVLCKRNHDWNATGKSIRYVRGGCVTCAREQSAQYQKLHPEKHLEDSRKYYEKHKQKKRDYDRAYYKIHQDKLKEAWAEYRKINPDVQRRAMRRYLQTEKGKETTRRFLKKHPNYRNESSKKWYRNNLERFTVYKQQRRARKLNNHAVAYTSKQLIAHIRLFGDGCAYCGSTSDKINLDHLIPISKGGSDTLLNLVPCCKSCNSSKSNKDVEEWYKSKPFYSRSRWLKILKILGKSEATLGQLPLF